MKVAYDSMLQSNSPAARVLAKYKSCVACTDLTGFGLLGHLIEMIQYESNEDETNTSSQKTAVRLQLSQIPLLPGALECIEKGILSTLHPQVSPTLLCQ
jgi:selenide,water dikinase